MVRSWLAVVLVCGFVSSALSNEAKIEPQSLGKQVENFALKDFRGKTHQLSDYADSQAVVLAFIGCECPVAKRYSVTLQALADQFADQRVTILAIDANQHDSITEMAAFARQHSLEIPFLKDLANRLADEVGAERTPEVFLLDRERKIRYRGRIDDRYQVGAVRNSSSRDDLKIAIEEVLAGKQISVPETKPVGCHIGRILEADETAEVTYSNQIARIFQNRCVACHREGQIAPFALTDYDEVVGWAEMISEVVEEQRMPPWHANPEHGQFANDRHLSQQEKDLIYRWVTSGAPQGDPQQLPEPRTFVEGWTLPKEPEQVFDITPEPYQVPAEGEVAYKYFSIDPGFTEDKWLQAAELRPGNLSVVHHILCFALPPGSRGEELEGGARGFLVGYVPGKLATQFPEGMAKKVPAGSRLIFQMHYTPIGSPQEDQSQLGLIFADAKDVKYEIQTTSALQRRLTIPPHDSNYKVEASSPRNENNGTLLLGFMPHMHLRGKAFRYVGIFPDGKEEILLDIPHYDFNWQTAYELAEPRPMPTGSYLQAIAHYDNSKSNIHNPDPTQTVRWGDQTWDEMMIGYFDIAVPVEEEAKSPGPAMDAAQQEANDKADQLIKKFDTNGDGVVAKEEVPQKGQSVFVQLDTNEDGQVTKEELLEIFKKHPAVMRLLR